MMTKKTILIVEDVSHNISILDNILKEKYDILVSKNGLDAISFACEKKPDLILLDLMIPYVDGFEVCKKLKANSLTSHIPIIFHTVKNDIDTIEQCFNFGGSDYITKPYIKNELLMRIDTHINISEYKKVANYKLSDSSYELKKTSHLIKDFKNVLVDISNIDKEYKAAHE